MADATQVSGEWCALLWSIASALNGGCHEIDPEDHFRNSRGPVAARRGLSDLQRRAHFGSDGDRVLTCPQGQYGECVFGLIVKTCRFPKCALAFSPSRLPRPVSQWRRRLGRGQLAAPSAAG